MLVGGRVPGPTPTVDSARFTLTLHLSARSVCPGCLTAEVTMISRPGFAPTHGRAAV